LDVIHTPGQRLTIRCQVSYSFGSYHTAWIRQAAGEGLEWIGMKSSRYSYYKDSLKKKFSINLDTSSKTVTLNGQNMQPEDSAVYYCARDTVTQTSNLRGTKTESKRFGISCYLELLSPSMFSRKMFCSSFSLITLGYISAVFYYLIKSFYRHSMPAAVTVTPGQRLTIRCQVTYSLSSYWTHWIRQAAGKGLEWIGMKYTGDSYYKDSLKNKFSIDLETSSSTVTLNGQNMQPEDSAVYYCAREIPWGGGMGGTLPKKVHVNF
uniref:Ig-like domain-containing protein n=1 Tax=Cyprinodon variegatus TaxID=28743 RepID=A0A3Q2DHC9_CYPVA